jgi:hypothetical protein
MKKLLILMLLPLTLLVYSAAAEPVNCVKVPEHNKWLCDEATATPIPPTITPTVTAIPTHTHTTVQETATAVPTATPVVPTATPTIAATANPTPLPPPAKAADGTYYLTQAKVYAGNFSCGNIGSTAHCVHIWNSSGVILQDFTITSTQGYGLQFDNGNIIQRGTITAPLGASGHQKVNVTFNDVTFNVQSVALQLLDTGCESVTPRRNRSITVRNSTFTNAGGTEMLYMKCAQDVTIEGNHFAPKSEWAVSLPDTVNAIIRNNTFNLVSEPTNWLGIELPKVAGALVENNTATGPAGDWLVWQNSGTTGLSVTANTVNGGMGVLCCVSPPSTGSGGLRH